jgi:hypothetical protein
MGVGVEAGDAAGSSGVPRGRRLALALALLLGAGVVVAIVLGNRSPSRNGAGTAISATGAATVQRRDLIETDTESGTLSYAGSHTVYNRLPGTITWIPTVGQLIKPGYVLYRVDNQPVLLLNGSTPAYRDLKSSDEAGPDVLELNTELVQLGYDPDGVVVDDEWQAATTSGVKALQATWDQTQTGELKLGTVVFLPGPQLVSAVESTVGSGVSLTDPPSQADFVSLTRTTRTSTPGQTRKNGHNHKHHPGPPSQEQQLRALLALLRAETAQLRGGQHSGGAGASTGKSSRSSSSGKASGSSSSKKPSSSNSNDSSSNAGDATAIMQTSSDHLIVTVDLAASAQSEAVVGEPVTVEMPSANTVSGRITAVSSVATSSSGDDSNNAGSASNGGGGGSNGNTGGSGSSAAVPVTIALNQPVGGAGLDQAAVSVNFSEAKATNVLSVPVTALLTTAGSTYAVQEVAPPHRLIPVTTGLFAAGYVEIAGSGIYPGLAVTDSQG